MTIYSYSRLKCFEQCPRKYKLKYIDKVKIDMKENVELFLGKRVHETLKKLYYDLWDNKMNTLGELLFFLRKEWWKNWDESIVIVKKKYSRKDYLSMAEQCIVNYYNSYKPFNHGRTIALEKRIFVHLDGSSNYKLCGYIDRVAKTKKGGYEIHDYKTSSHFPIVEYTQNDRQLALYALALKLRYPYIRKVQLIWHFLKFNKEICVRLSDKRVKQLKKDVVQSINKIESSEKYPAKPSALCHWCRFKSHCTVMIQDLY